MIRRWLPYPALAVSLLIMWLLLMQSISPGQLLLGVLAAAVGGWTMTTLGTKSTPVRRWRKVLRLAGMVALDIMRSNVAVARIILMRPAGRKSTFLRIRLELQNEYALTILALIITATPGTAWVQFDRTSRILIIHVFDLVDEEEWIELLKSGYESLLMAIFES